MATKGVKSNFRAHRAERRPGLTHFTSACCTEPPLYVKVIINPQQICAKRHCLAKHGLLEVGLDLQSAGSWAIVKAGLLKITLEKGQIVCAVFKLDSCKSGIGRTNTLTSFSVVFLAIAPLTFLVSV